MATSKYKVGQRVYYKPASYDVSSTGIKEGIVSKVGRKYVYVDGVDRYFRTIKFGIQDGLEVNDYGTRRTLYTDRKGLEEELEKKELVSRFARRGFDWHEYSLNTLRKIEEICRREEEGYENG